VPGAQSTIAPNAPRGILYPGGSGIPSSVWKQDWKDFARRIGFAGNIGGNGKTVIRAGYGMFYSFPEGLLYTRTNQTQPVDLTINISNPPSFDNPYQSFPGGDLFPRGHTPPSQFGSYVFPLPLAGGALDPAAKAGYTQTSAHLIRSTSAAPADRRTSIRPSDSTCRASTPCPTSTSLDSKAS
jgi:hypothetical protein